MEDLVSQLPLIARTTIAITFLMALYGINKVESSGVLSKLAITISSNGAAILTTIGIFFTFLGIFIALTQFDTNNIREAITPLLDGMKLAFESSVWGLGGALAFRLIKPMRSTAAAKEDASAGDILEEMQKTTAGINQLNSSLVGDSDSSVVNQLRALRDEFKSFAEKMAEDGSAALVKALEEVMRDFNAKINEQFGDNFKQLNEAVGALLEWQKEYKIQLEQLIEVFKENQKTIDLVRESITKVEESTKQIPDNMAAMQGIVETTDSRLKELHEGLASLSEMRQNAQDALPQIQQNIDNLTTGLKEGTEQLFNSAKNLGEQSDLIIKELNTQIQNTTQELSSTMNESIEQFNQTTQNQLQDILNNMGTNLTSITKQFADDYEPFLQQLRSAVNDANSAGGNRPTIESD
jgi:methyl-accepting chemotaxis protein